VAVVVATRNRVQELLTTLATLERLPERPRVVVVDNGSEDGTASWVRKRHADAELVELDRNLGAAARTVGARLAGEPYVAFSDDDSWWAPGSLARAVEFLERHPRLAVLAARVLVGPEERLDPVCAEMAASPLPPAADLPGPPVLGFVACGAVVRRPAFLQAGGFHPRFGVGGEEELLAVDLAARGWGLAYVEEVVAHHHPSPSRDPAGRRRVQVRNALWSAWLRRPPSAVARQAARVLPAALREPAARAGVLEAVRGLPWVLRERRPVGPELEEALRALGG
ncbi:MAG TPA: glycosyltransferase, partial [Actinomycetota bacterium]|nr:glycosyltransferase [Actinomycetota bacterium]